MYILKPDMNREQRERAMAEARVGFNNAWSGTQRWKCDAHEMLDNFMQDKSVNSFFVPVKLNENAVDVLLKDDTVNRVISVLLEINDLLPYQPDTAFEIAWREFEILLKAYNTVCWKKGMNQQTGKIDHIETTKLISNVADFVANTLCSKDPALAKVVKQMLRKGPMSMFRFCILRMYRSFELAIEPQFESVKNRAIDVLHRQLYQDLDEQYGLSGDAKPCGGSLRNASLLLRRIIGGDKDLVVNKHKVSITLKERVEFFISGILYTARCERVHGDYFSPLKSSMVTLHTFGPLYWQLASAYLLTWIMLNAYIEKKGLSPICDQTAISDALSQTFDSIELLKPEDDKIKD